MLHGDYELVDHTGNTRIFLGDGSESVVGAPGDTLAGGTAGNQFLDGGAGNQSETSNNQAVGALNSAGARQMQ